jgi:hypothetical protein
MKRLFEKFRVGLLVIVLLLAGLIVSPKAFAGTLTNTSVAELGTTSSFTNPMIASDAQQLAVQFKLATASPTSATLVFSSGTATSGSIPIAGTGCTTYFPGDTAIGGSPTASGSSATITISTLSGLSSTSVTYCMLLGNSTTNAFTNPAAGVITVALTIGSDTQTDAIDVLSSGANAYSVSATVLPTFTLSLSGTSDALGTLSSSSTITSTGITATINTNAQSGWFLWADDANGTNGLTSASSGSHIAAVSTGSAHTFTTGSNQYGLGVTVDNTTNYAYGGGTTGSGLSNTAYNEIATNNAPASNLTTVLHELADITATQAPATDYTDTITVIGAGSF